MDRVVFVATPDGDEYETKCTCCGRPIYWGYGWLESGRAPLAAYWYQWSEGHEGRFCLAIARFDEEEHLVPGVVCVRAWVHSNSIHYSVLEPPDAPWSDFGKFGAAAGREEALTDKSRVFELVDAIAANEKRISSRIDSSGLHA
jgi:hypothetical protein